MESSSNTPSQSPFASPGGPDWLPPTVDQLQPLLPEYELSRVLGVGGMAAVYRGTEKIMGREVAIKILPLSAIAESDMKYAERFQQEAQTMAKLSHPNIIKVFNCGEAGSTEDGNQILWFAMEFVEGCDIHQYLHGYGGRLKPEHAMAVTCHVLDGLVAAHAESVIHRDIKPANILIDNEGCVKIADFGAAKIIDSKTLGLTVNNLAMGTPEYAAPECMVEGAEVDGRADLYSVGAMLYQLLTGEVPRGQFKMPSELVEGVDQRFDHIVSKALQTDPNDRYEDAMAFRADLDRIMLLPQASFDPKSGALKISQGRKIEDGADFTGPVMAYSSLKLKTDEPVEKKSKKGIVLGAVAVALGALAGAFFLLKPSPKGSEISGVTPVLALVATEESVTPEPVPDKSDPPDSTEEIAEPAPITSPPPDEEKAKPELPPEPEPAPEPTESAAPVAAGNIAWSDTSSDLIVDADPERSKAPQAWTQSPDGTLQIDAGALTEGPKNERRAKYVLSFDGDYAPPYRLEIDAEMVAKNQLLMINFPVNKRNIQLKINTTVAGIFHTQLQVPELQDYPGTIANEGDRKTFSINVIPGDEENHYRIEVEKDDQPLLSWKGEIDENFTHTSHKLKITAWPDAVWKFHRISLFKHDPDKIPEPEPVMITSAPEPTPPEPPTTLVVETKPAPKPESGLPPYLEKRVARLEEVIEKQARTPFRKKTTGLASSYGNALKKAIETATSEGDLDLVLALREEFSLIGKLHGLISSSTPEELPELPDIGVNANPIHKNLRKVWQNNIQRFHNAHDSTRGNLTLKFANSLKLFESELTKEGKIDRALAVRDYRTELTGKKQTSTATPRLVASKPDAEILPTVPQGDLILAGQYQPVPTGNPFPLPMTRRPTEPCKVVAWRFDGKPIQKNKFEAWFGSVPDKLGTLVDIDMWERADRGRQYKIAGLTADGKVRINYPKAQALADHISGAVKLAGIKDVGIVLLEDGTCKVFPYWGPFNGEGWTADLDRVNSWKNVVDIDAGERHVMALTADGNAMCAGDSYGSKKATTIPPGLGGRIFRIATHGLMPQYFVFDPNGGHVDLYKTDRQNPVRHIPKASRIFGSHPRVTDKDGKKLDMYSHLARADHLIGSKPNNVTFAHSIGGNHLDEEVWVATIREGKDDWRFWGDLGKICKIDSQKCQARAKNCRKIFLNPPYAIGLKPVTAMTKHDWTGAGESVQITAAKPVRAAPEFINTFPLPAPKRPKECGSIEVYRRDGKPLNREDPEVSLIPGDLGDNVVDIRVRNYAKEFCGVALLKDGTVRAWGTKLGPKATELSALTNIVRIEAGNDRVLTLDEKGNYFFLWPGNTRKGKAENNEPIRQIGLFTYDAFLLTESGRLISPQEVTTGWMPKNLPLAAALECGYHPYILGIDGKWRSWSKDSNQRVLAQIESEGIPGDHYSTGGEIWWTNRSQQVRRFNYMGVEMGLGPFKGKKIKKVTGGAGLHFVKNPIDRWGVSGSSKEQRKLLESKIQGSIKVEASATHVFCLKGFGA